MCVMDDQGTNRLTRTQWLLVVVIGLIGWLAGFVLQAPLVAIPGAAAFLVGIVGAIFTRQKA